MDEKTAIIHFWKAVQKNNELEAENALRFISTETINREDDDGYDYLIDAVQNENPCAVRVLLKSGRCNLEHEENLCGMTAEEFSKQYPEDSPIRQAFLELAKEKNGNGTDRQ